MRHVEQPISQAGSRKIRSSGIHDSRWLFHFCSRFARYFPTMQMEIPMSVPHTQGRVIWFAREL